MTKIQILYLATVPLMTIILLSSNALANRLADTSSPYLLQHAHNPVDWYPWGEEALVAAKRENKPIFLSIGYSTCYWCHVMEREVFEQQDVADIINKHFISIKIDREERPDLDEIYMTATHMINGRGGWPNSLFLTPDLQPFYAETYIPHDEFIYLIESTAKNWQDNEADIKQQAARISSRIKSYFTNQQTGGNNLPANIVSKQYLNYLKQTFDNREGGFGSGTKFPREMALWFLLDYHKLTNDADALAMAQLTLEKMFAGGIHDHIGGGFHRYSTDRLWHVPHFEKMLYNQAMMARAYTQLYSLSNYPHHKDIVEQIFAYVENHMTGENGEFYSALDAETDAVEGDYYVWRKSEISKLLGDDADIFHKIFAMKNLPTFRGHKHTDGKLIYLKKPMMELAFELNIPYAELLEKIQNIRTTLHKYRIKRKLPRLDDKTITAWNGLMIDAYARAGIALDNPQYIKIAAKAADFILSNMRNQQGELYRIYSKGEAYQQAYAEDYAYFIQGLVSLYKANKDKHFLGAAIDLSNIADRLFLDKTNGGYYFSQNNKRLLARSKQAEDSAVPSANGVLANAMLDLYQITGNMIWKEKAENILKAFSRNIQTSAASYGHLVHAALRLQHISSVKIQDISTHKNTDIPVTMLSKDKVNISAKIKQNSVNITMDIDDSWHLNANPASLDFLIATSVDVQSDAPIEVKIIYPQAKKLATPLGEIDIYEGKITITADISPEIPQGTQLRILSQLQACKDTTCLAPSDIVLTIAK